MNVREKLFVIALGALSTLGSSLLLPGWVLAQGQDTCNCFLSILYPEFPTSSANPPGCVSPNPAIKCTPVGAKCQCFIDPSSKPAIEMEIGLAAGDIQGG